MKGTSNYLLGRDRSAWVTSVPHYRNVKYGEVYPGIDLVFYGNERRLEYDFVVSAGADPARIKLDFAGAKKLRVNDQGDLVISTAGGELIQHKAVVFQGSATGQKAIANRYILVGERQVALQLGDYDASLPLFIDPVLSYSTYLGGKGNETAYDIAVDAEGNAIITGETESAKLPTGQAVRSFTSGRGSDVFVTKLSADGNEVLFITYLGGDELDSGRGVAVDAAGNIYLTGETQSANFPTLYPLQKNAGGASDVFIAKLEGSGGTLVYSTYLGGNQDDAAVDIALDASGNAYITGYTRSANFPVINPLQAFLHGGADAFVAKLSAGGELLDFSTFLGGSADDYGRSLAVDKQGNVYLTGETASGNFPTLNPFQPQHAGGVTDAFVTKLSAGKPALDYSSYLGGDQEDSGRAIAVDPTGVAYVTGYTRSANFPVANPLQPAFGGATDAFVTKIDASGLTLASSTYLGGTDNDYGYGIALDTLGNVFVAGGTTSTDFPTASPLQASLKGKADAFAAKLNSALSALIYSTYIGGDSEETAYGVYVDRANQAYVTGFTESWDFPTLTSLQPTAGGSRDVFAFKLSSSSFHTISGRVTDDSGKGLSGSTVVLSGNQSATTQTDAEGRYAFGDLAVGGDYVVAPEQSGFSPSEQSFPNLTADQTADFKRASSLLDTYTISGQITKSGGGGLAAVPVTLGGSQSGTTQTDASGNYSFTSLASGGNYTITPNDGNFTPTSQTFNNLSANQTANFTGSLGYNISGQLTVSGGGAINTGAVVSVSGTVSKSIGDDGAGNYSFVALTAHGNYVITPYKPGYVFTPASVTVNNLSGNQTVNFTASVVYSIGGSLTDLNNTPLTSVTITVSGSQNSSLVWPIAGKYLVEGLAPGGNYTITPSKAGYIFTPPSQTFNNLSANQTANFKATNVVSISGQVTDTNSAALADVTLTLGGSATGSGVTNSSGNYTIYAPYGGDYTITPSKPGYDFTPASRLLSAVTSNTGSINFTQRVPLQPVTLALTGQDVGSVGVAGSTTATNGVFTVAGSGSDIAGSADAFHFAAQQLTGEGQIIARVTGLQNTGSAAKVGLMIRESLAAGSKHTAVFINPSGQLSLLWRSSTGGGTGSSGTLSTEAVPVWLMLMRRGTTVSAFKSLDGQNWTYLTGLTISLTSTAYFGLTVTSGNNAALNTASFDNVGIQSGTPNSPPQVSITSPLPGGTYNQPANFTINATASDNDGSNTIAQVEFYANGVLLGVDPFWPYSQTLNGLTAGVYNLTARVVDTDGGATVSPIVPVTVNPSTTTTLTATADTVVSSNWPTNIYGSSNPIQVGKVPPDERISYFKFDISNLPSTVANARLRIYASFPTTGSYGMSCYAVADTSWTEASTNWNNRPSTGSSVGSATVSGSNYAWYEIDVTSYVASEKAAGHSLVSLALQSALTASTHITIYSREAGGNKPELRVASVATAAPVISSLSPNSGPINTAVTISGSNFGALQGNSTVTFNGVTATPLIWSYTSLVVNVPIGAATGSVIVTVAGQASNSVTFTVAGTTGDTDGDGLPDSWEMQYFGNLNQDAAGDPDGDGKNNLTEYLQGTNPTKGSIADPGNAVNLKVYTPTNN